jgi:hypothetical protein
MGCGASIPYRELFLPGGTEWNNSTPKEVTFQMNERWFWSLSGNDFDVVKFPNKEKAYKIDASAMASLAGKIVPMASVSFDLKDAESGDLIYAVRPKVYLPKALTYDGATTMVVPAAFTFENSDGKVIAELKQNYEDIMNAYWEVHMDSLNSQNFYVEFNEQSTLRTLECYTGSQDISKASHFLAQGNRDVLVPEGAEPIERDANAFYIRCAPGFDQALSVAIVAAIDSYKDAQRD